MDIKPQQQTIYYIVFNFAFAFTLSRSLHTSITHFSSLMKPQNNMCLMKNVPSNRNDIILSCCYHSLSISSPSSFVLLKYEKKRKLSQIYNFISHQAMNHTTATTTATTTSTRVNRGKTNTRTEKIKNINFVYGNVDFRQTHIN